MIYHHAHNHNNYDNRNVYHDYHSNIIIMIVNDSNDCRGHYEVVPLTTGEGVVGSNRHVSCRGRNNKAKHAETSATQCASSNTPRQVALLLRGVDDERQTLGADDERQSAEGMRHSDIQLRDILALPFLG